VPSAGRLARKPPETPGNRTVGSNLEPMMSEYKDLLAEDVVTSEPFSAGKSLFQPGKYREIRGFGLLGLAICCCKHRVSLSFLVEFPKRSNREFLEWNRES
jgi:hypothetical protein